MTKNLKDAIYQYGNTLHSLRNETKSDDPISRESTSKMNEELDQIESSIRSSRPILSGKSIDPNLKFAKQYKNALDKYLKKGIETDISNIANSIQGTNDPLSAILQGNSNGYPMTMKDKIFERITRGSIIRQYARIITVSDDNPNFAIAKETIAAEWTNNVNAIAAISNAFECKTIKICELTAQPKITQRMIDDQEIDVESLLADSLSDIFLESEENAFINGMGVNQPTGILSYASGTSTGQIERIINSNGASSATDISLASLLALQNALEGKYERDEEICFIASKSAISQIRVLKDATNQFIWTPGILMNKQDTLFGVPLHKTNALSSVTTNKEVIIYGNLKKGYQIADKMDIKIQRDPFSQKPFIVFFATKKVGGDVIDTKAIKILKMA